MEKVGNYYLHPGYIFVSEAPYLIHTVLGSCVSVCIWDSFEKYGGMNHFIFSRAAHGNRNCKYGDIATRYLIKLLLDMGSKTANMKAHVLGGGQHSEFSPKIGNENVEVALEVLKKSRIEIVTTDVGGSIGRKVVFNNRTGEFILYKGENIRKSDWYQNG